MAKRTLVHNISQEPLSSCRGKGVVYAAFEKCIRDCNGVGIDGRCNYEQRGETEDGELHVGKWVMCGCWTSALVLEDGG